MEKRLVEIYKEVKPALVFMDIVMPVKDGIQAVTEIKEFDSNAKVVMASSSGTKEHLKRPLKQELLNLYKNLGNKSKLLGLSTTYLRKGNNLCLHSILVNIY